jgi:hypothetical protein
VAGKRSLRAPLIAGNGPLSKVPPAAAFLVVAVVFGVGVLVGGTVGAVLLGVLALGVLVLLIAAWRALGPAERAMRIGVLLVLVAVAVSVVGG